MTGATTNGGGRRTRIFSSCIISIITYSILFIHSFRPISTSLKNLNTMPKGSEDKQNNIANLEAEGMNSPIGTTNLRPCRIAVENKADYHYEVIESAIMQFPLPWNTFNCSKEKAIADVALTEHMKWTANEKQAWQDYFETHLKGTARPRKNGDGAVMHFGSIEKYSNYSRQYDAYIGVSCDSFDVVGQMNRGPNQYCVLHGRVAEKIKRRAEWEDLQRRVCFVNPMHSPYPYFIPSDLPQFKREEFRKGDKIRLCLKGSSPPTSLQYVAEGVRGLQQDGEEPNIEIFVIGRLKKGGVGGDINSRFQNVSHLVKLFDESDYYKFQEMMSKCHALLPLIHPWEELGKKYFPWSGAGKLSGFMSQAIGLKLPLLVHDEIREVYKEHLSAPVWNYTTKNLNDTQSFVDAFGAMVKELPDFFVGLSAE